MSSDDPSTQPTDMPLEDKRVIWASAQGDRQKRERAIAIHRKWIPTLGARGTLEQRYMAEVDHPEPDYGLRERFRCAMLQARPVGEV